MAVATTTRWPRHGRGYQVGERLADAGAGLDDRVSGVARRPRRPLRTIWRWPSRLSPPPGRSRVIAVEERQRALDVDRDDVVVELDADVGVGLDVGRLSSGSKDLHAIDLKWFGREGFVETTQLSFIRARSTSDADSRVPGRAERAPPRRGRDGRQRPLGQRRGLRADRRPRRRRGGAASTPPTARCRSG